MRKPAVTILVALLTTVGGGCTQTTPDDADLKPHSSRELGAPIGQESEGRANEAPEIDSATISTRGGKDERMNSTKGQGDQIDPEVAAAISRFRTQPDNREEPARKLLPMIKRGMPSQEVEAMLGRPSETFWDYSLFYSSSLAIRFDSDGGFVDLSSDILGEVNMQGEGQKDETDPEITAAISEFKTRPHSRREAAKKLLPLIKTGMRINDVEALLGAPSEITWEYRTSESSSLIIRFDADRKVEEVTTTGLSQE